MLGPGSLRAFSPGSRSWRKRDTDSLSEEGDIDLERERRPGAAKETALSCVEVLIIGSGRPLRWEILHKASV